MAVNHPDDPVASGGNLPVMKLPEHINGFIDLEILVNIHSCLGDSEKSDDTALAKWIKQSYLQEPVEPSVEIGRPIRDSEGFAKLDKAYRRVRQLTGKAQDKWPFFDKNGKKMSSTVVKNAILGHGVTNMPRADTNGQVHDTPISNVVDGQGSASITTRKTDQKDWSPSSKADVSRDSVQGGYSTSTALGIAHNSTGSTDDGLRDAGAGKVRGPRGRYVNKCDSPLIDKKGLETKPVTKPRIRAALYGKSDENGTTGGEDLNSAQVSLVTHRSAANGEGETLLNDHTPGTSVRNAESASEDLHSPGSGILAAEAEAVTSTLDRLPPGLTHKKRKSESSISQDGPKRNRGSRGGVLGRPRRSDTFIEHPQAPSEQGSETNTPEVRPEIEVKMPARRSSRKSAASDLEMSTPWDPTADVLFNGFGQKQTALSALMHGAAEVHSGDRTSADAATADDQEAKTETYSVMSEDTSAVHTTTATRPPEPLTSSDPAKQKKRVSFSPETQHYDLKFFARISTNAGTQELPLAEEDLTSEIDLVKRYAAWQNEGNANVTFDVFKNIVKFAR